MLEDKVPRLHACGLLSGERPHGIPWGLFLFGRVSMPSNNIRYHDSAARMRVRAIVKARIMAGEPCALCGQPIDIDAPQWHIDPRDGKRKRAPWSWEVDEIVPVSRGGSPYDPENVQPAHRICNQRAGDKRPRPQTVRRVARVEGATTADW